MNQKDLNKVMLKVKLRLLKLHYETSTGHIGGNFSCIDSLVVLYHSILKPHDLFILSKGHSACALYVTLWSKGLISEDVLKTYGVDGTVLPAHPSGSNIPGLLFSTGSLGHGPSLACGLALANKLKKTKKLVFCLCSDGEFQEGSVWEAMIFANHHKLNNLIILIDQNKLQGYGKTKKIVSYDDLSSRVRAFGLNVQSVDGHCALSIYRAFKERNKNRSNVIILNTIKGNQVHFENKLESHYLPINKSLYDISKKKLKEFYFQ